MTRCLDVRPSKYSIIDFILSLVSVGHFIYACYLQTKCVNSTNTSSWNCYNAFGYRLFNYVLPNLVSVLVQSGVQLAHTIRHREDDSSTMTSVRNVCKMLLLGATIIMNVILCIIFIPFLITNVLPMLVGFCWLLLPLLIVLTVTYAIFITTVASIIGKCGLCQNGYCKRFFLTHFLVGLQVFGCLIISMAYNYSQYCYFGGGYIRVLGYEFESRETKLIFQETRQW